MSDLHELVQPSGVQALWPQSIGVPGVLHIPEPSHVLAGVNMEPEQLPGMQDIPLAYRWHPPFPSQVPSFPHEVAGSAAQSLLCLRPSCTGAQVPSVWPVLDFTHAVQASVQALSQQTWSGEQKPDPHSDAAVHMVPGDFLTLHVPLLQY